MKTYSVRCNYTEIVNHIATIEVQAETPQEARDIAQLMDEAGDISFPEEEIIETNSATYLVSEAVAA